MLKFDFMKRMSAAQALKHPYFKEFELYPPVFVEKPCTVAAAEVAASSAGPASPASSPHSTGSS